MRGGTLFSGIGTPEVACPEIEWAWCAEIDPFASAVLKARFPHVPNLGDVTKVNWDAVEPVDLIVFGSPCQSFSVAGKRLGLDDPRGNLALVALAVVARLRPRWFVFENVPGLLSSDGGRDFGALLGTVGECGYGWAYRTLDAQYAGVPQRRRRVFLVGHSGGDWRSAAAVLFEPESLSRDPPPSREERQRTARPVASCVDGGSGYRNDADTADNLIAHSLSAARGTACANAADLETYVPTISPTISAKWKKGGGPAGDEHYNLVAHALTADGFDASEDGTGRGPPLIPVQNATRGKSQNGLGIGGEVMFTLDGASQHAVADPISAHEARTYTHEGRNNFRLRNCVPASLSFTERTRAAGRNLEAQEELAYALCNPGSGGRTHSRQLLDRRMAVRRLMPVECERLQGLPDDFTLVTYRGKPAVDGPRYRALGNAMAVPVVRWILKRIAGADT